MSIACFHHVSAAQYHADAPADAMPVDAIPLPRRATVGSAGYDFVCPVDVTLSPGEAVTIPTGIRCEMQPGWVLLLFPRSGLGFKHQLCLANTVGVIDSDYFGADNEGHILVRLVNRGDHAFSIGRGERFCQGLFLPHGLAQEDAVGDIRHGGFGST